LHAMRGAERGEEGAREEAWVGRDFGGERERACRFWACFSRRGLVWACFSPTTDDDCARGNRGCTSRGLGLYMEGEGVACVWGARGRAE